MPASNVSRVRSDGFSKNSTICLPDKHAAKIGRTRLHRRGQLKRASEFIGREVLDRNQVAAGYAAIRVRTRARSRGNSCSNQCRTSFWVDEQVKRTKVKCAGNERSNERRSKARSKRGPGHAPFLRSVGWRMRWLRSSRRNHLGAAIDGMSKKSGQELRRAPRAECARGSRPSSARWCRLPAWAACRR